MPFITHVTSVDIDQLANVCHLIWIYTGHFLVQNNLMNQKAKSADSDQTARMSRQIWIYTVCHGITAISHEVTG
jgi:hypothetical protein